MADAVVNFVVEKLGAMILEEAKLLGGVREELEYIKDELNAMNAFLEDAEESQERAKIKREWVKQVKELAYDAEDCIDEFKLRLEKPLATSLVGRFRISARYVRSLRARRWIATEIQRIKTKAEEASKRAQRYGFTSMNAGATGCRSRTTTRHDPRQNALFVEEADLVGIDAARDELIGWLLQDNEPRLDVISVVGGGGLGKTTLIKRVFDSPSINSGHFKCRAWIAVSESFNRTELLTKMFRKLFPKSEKLATTKDEYNELADSTDELEIAEKIKDHLKDKRYVIVLDDIWTVDAWESIKLVLPDSNNGSRVMVTTRKEQVAYTCSSLNHKHVHKLSPLSPEHSRQLLCLKVFDGPDHNCPTHLVHLSEQLLKKCGGLPLAIVIMGRLLASKPSKTSQVEWQNLLNHFGSELETSSTLSIMNQILALSFNDLPYHLKKCFLYVSVFPEDYEINRKRLQKLWIAEGFVAERRDMTVEDVAEIYFNELISKSMIQPAEINGMGKVSTCRVHDIMLEFIVSKANEENLVSVFGRLRTSMPQDVIRRISIHPNSRLDISGCISLSQIRSFIMFSDAGQSFLSPRLRLLRVLDLEGCGHLRNHHLRVLGEFHHLRYLSLKNTGIWELPESFGKLRNLEMFDFRGGMLREIPNGIINLQKLRYILGGDDLNAIRLPRGIGKLQALKELTGLHVDRTKGVVKELGQLTQLTRLCVGFSAKESGNDLCVSLSKLSKCLRHLQVFSPSLTLLDCIPSPPLLLESLKFHGNLGTLPRWVGSLTNLVKIGLIATHLEDDAVQVLQALPSLVKLVIGEDALKNDQLCFGSEGFQSLKILFLYSSHLKALRFEEGAMPRLERLVMAFFARVEDTNLGIEHLANLKEVELYGTEHSMVDILKGAIETHPKKPRLTALDIWTPEKSTSEK